MRNSSILKWNKNNSKNNLSAEGGSGKEKKWLHSPETLTNSNVVYLVKVRFLLQSLLFYSLVTTCTVTLYMNPEKLNSLLLRILKPEKDSFHYQSLPDKANPSYN